MLTDNPQSETTSSENKVYSLADRYEMGDGRIFLNGNHVLVRMIVEQMRSDLNAGLRTRAFVTGYPGSPLGTIDMALRQAGKYLSENGITHQPAQNEEFAATSLMGTQMLDEHPHPDIDGVVGYWYGKGPGLDRSGDALKHGNFAGTSRYGAVVILSGEDHEAKSSTVPYQQEFSFEHHGIPVLYPASIQEFLDMGLHAAAMSRFSGCWVALKLVGALCDGGEVVKVHRAGVPIVFPPLQISGKSFEKTANHRFFPIVNVETERRLYQERHAAVLAYAQANGLNQIVTRGPTDRVGIISAGKSWADTSQALDDLGLSGALPEHGIRLAKLGLLCPMDREFVQEFARGLTTIIVVEEKRDFIERQIAAAAIGSSVTEVLGKKDDLGQILFPIEGGLNSDIVAQALGRVLSARVRLPTAGLDRLTFLTNQRAAPRSATSRVPNYCSGCPHNVSTLLAPGQVAWGAPGCHLFAALMDKPEKRVEATTQLGGEGLPWIGLSPYTTRRHIVQNVGDGALFHSSYQNIRYAVETGVNITFKLLINGVLANTGGQKPISSSTVVDLLKRLSLERIARIVLISKEPKQYRGVTLPTGIQIRPVEALENTMKELEETPGVTIVIYDGTCANERRRRQKRGLLPKPARYTIVNEEVCENCGDCGAKANCMSLQKVKTEFGLKTQIHQSSCNQDQACIEGECPSFVTVNVQNGSSIRRYSPRDIEASLLVAAPPVSIEKPFHVYLPGLGGTGVLTVSAILAQAAALDGLEVKSYDQTGASQKWGAVLSSLILSPPHHISPVNSVGRGKADLYLALDILAAADQKNLACCDAGRTKAIINSGLMPNGEMIRNSRLQAPIDEICDTIRSVSNGSAAININARDIAESLFGDHLMTNMIAIGVACQAGWLPISTASIEAAIELNGAQVKENINAFRAGRLSQSDPNILSSYAHQKPNVIADRVEQQRVKIDHKTKETWARVVSANPWMNPATKELIEKRFVDLVRYQNVSYAMEYVGWVSRIAEVERAISGDSFQATITTIVARNLHKVMAYKDEYEVANLLTQSVFESRLRGMFTGKVSISYNLQPPLARRMGIKRKVNLGPWFRPAMVILARMKFLRGTWFDPFRRLQSRREERELIVWYTNLIEQSARLMRPENVSDVAVLLSLPDEIRGYEQIKSTAIVAARGAADKLLGGLSNSKSRIAAMAVAK